VRTGPQSLKFSRQQEEARQRQKKVKGALPAVPKACQPGPGGFWGGLGAGWSMIGGGGGWGAKPPKNFPGVNVCVCACVRVYVRVHVRVCVSTHVCAHESDVRTAVRVCARAGD
jgi:hypothetical protein